MAQERAVITSESGQLIVAVIAFSLLMSPLWIAIARRLIRVIMLGVTSLRGTLQAVETRRTAALVRHLLALWAILLRAWQRLRLARWFRRRAKAQLPADSGDEPALLIDRSDAPDTPARAGPDNA